MAVGMVERRRLHGIPVSTPFLVFQFGFELAGGCGGREGYERAWEGV